MNKTLLIFLLMAGLCIAGPNKVLDLVDSGDFTNVLGSEKVINGDFSSSAGWNLGTGWSIGGGDATKGGGAASNLDRADGSFLAGKSYLIKVDISAHTSGSLKVELPSSQNEDLGITGTGCYYVIITASVDGGTFSIFDFTSFDGSIDSISIKEVLSPWIPGNEWSFDNTVVNWLGAGTDTTLSQPTIKLVDGNTYGFTVTITNTDFAAADTYMAFQLGGGTVWQARVDQAVSIFLVCGNSPNSGLEITAVNGTAGDTMTLDDISVIVEQFKPSNNLDSVYVSGSILVPAGTAVVDEDFSADTGWTKGTGWTIDAGDNNVALCDGSQIADSDLVLDTPPLTDKKTYLVTYTMTRSAGTLTPVVGTALGTARSTADTFSEILVANGTAFTFRADSAFAGSVDNVEVFEMTTGPGDEYPWDEFTDYSSGAEPLGIYNGERVYKSVGTHALGDSGADVPWYLRQRISNGKWYITTVSPNTDPTPTGSRWIVSFGFIGSYVGASGTETGTAIVTNGPTDHSIASGSPALKTNGGRIFLNGTFNNINDIRETQWAYVSIITPLSGNDSTDRLISFETADGVGYYWNQTAANTFNATWTGTTAVDLDFTAAENTVHSLMNVSDIAANDSWFTVDGQVTDSQTDAATLDAVSTVTLVLGGRADSAADLYNGVYGPQYFLDLTSVATVDTAWITGLAQVINSAGTEATAIANAIFTYDNNIAGHYWPLNEPSAGDVSNYYGLGYDITDDTQADGFYILVSPAGVTGADLGVGGGYRGRYEDDYRDRR